MSRILQEEMIRYANDLEHLKDDDLLEEVQRARMAQQNVNRIGRTRAIGMCYAANTELTKRFGADGERRYSARFGDTIKRSRSQQLAAAYRSA
ncbi:MAG TPA: hypothetical protein VHL31_19630 [Geminicoccus sp.]|jgi:hypothetical protein|uniref:hypothetical protein n=1 Tax=Geminicoccus sp. TaxID=2024832 RepID=UPI002E33B6AF|nr:hypothetical protein [Geminicoccus sp.]HEX2528498.1 hypothetical protein [Geminicoccus sp.]